MKPLVLVVLAIVLVAPAPQQARDPASYVDPFIGTGPAPTATYGQEFVGGGVFPGAAYPTGMLYWSPDTVEHNVPGGYFYPDRTLKGFSLTHFSGRGCTVYLDVPILPINGLLDVSPRAQPAVQRATFSHANEKAEQNWFHGGFNAIEIWSVPAGCNSAGRAACRRACLPPCG